MENKQEKEFIGGFYPKAKHPNVPDFIKGVGTFNVEKALEFFNRKKEEGVEWVNYQTKATKADENKYYAEVDLWKPTQQEDKSEEAKEAIEEDMSEIPF